MEHIYLQGGKALATKLHNAWKQTQRDLTIRISEIQREYGSDGVFTINGRLAGLVFDPANGGPALRGFNRSSEIIEGKKYFVLRPNGRYREGKAFRDQCAAYNRLAEANPPFSDYVVAHFNLARTVSGQHPGSPTGMAMFYTTAGIAKGKLILVVPTNQENPPPEVPGLKRIRKSAYIALTEE